MSSLPWAGNEQAPVGQGGRSWDMQPLCFCQVKLKEHRALAGLTRHLKGLRDRQRHGRRGPLC